MQGLRKTAETVSGRGRSLTVSERLVGLKYNHSRFARWLRKRRLRNGRRRHTIRALSVRKPAPVDLAELFLTLLLELQLR
jgi:hypothetical protein